MERIVIYDVPDDGKKCLGRAVWVFIYFENRGLVLDYYAREERDSLRKKFKTRSAYNRLSYSRKHDIENIAEKDAPLPEWVKERAKELFFNAIKVRKWDETK